MLEIAIIFHNITVFSYKYSLDEHKRLVKNLTDPKLLNGNAHHMILQKSF